MTLTYPMSIDQGIKVNGKTVIKRNKIFGIVSASLILFFGCSDSNDNVIATAAGHRLSVEQVVEILART